jgi:predicted MPP superfamily phosphohydrolase
VFLLILGGILACDVVVAVAMVRRAPTRALKAVLLAIAAFPLLELLWMLVARHSSLRVHEWLPMPLIAFSYLWSLIVAPVSTLGLGGRALFRRLRRRPPGPPDLTRRSLLKTSAALTPPLLAGGMLAYALPRLGDFRVRRLTLPVPGLPEELEGLTIAHLSDLHYGKFTKPADIDRVVAAVNGLGADLHLFTGDLIDLSIDDLPAALDALRRLNAPEGLFVCEGNHDLIDDGDAFRRRVRDAGVPLLLDDTRILEIRGKRLQVCGVTWARDQAGRRAAVERVRRERDPGAFPILLAHHPHSFDEAQGFPLTLSGHTHGGMLMWNERYGAGPILFRYWSGPYEKSDRSLMVSNGIGNWFPLRTHAPAEVVHLTLAREA